MPRRAPQRSRRRPASAPNAMGIVCVVAGLGLLAVMGVAIRDEKAPLPPVPVRAPFVRAEVAPSQPRVEPRQKAENPISALKRRISAAEKAMPQIKQNERGPGFEEARVALLAKISDARDELGLYLDTHPSDASANRLWDRTLRLYAALRKL